MDEQAIEAELQAKCKKGPRLTPAMIDEQIVHEYYSRASQMFGENSKKAILHDAMKCLTICVLVLKNGFTVVGESACASPENFDYEIGRKLAREHARSKFRRVWRYAASRRPLGWNPPSAQGGSRNRENE